VEAVVGLKIARSGWESFESGELPLAAPVASLDGVTFQQVVAWLPTRFGGLGLRDSVGGRFAAFLGSVEQAVPALVSVCERSPAFKSAVGSVEVLCGSHQRWRPAFESGCRLGEEVRVAASSLRLEASSLCAWVGVPEVPSVFCEYASCVGGGSKSGLTRGKLTVAREELLQRGLLRALEECPFPGARAVLGYPQWDKLSAAWVRVLRCGDRKVECEVFAEVVANHLCVFSPAVSRSGLGGAPLGDSTVDPHGDQVRVAKVDGGFEDRHSTVAAALRWCFHWAGAEFVSEVFSEFADLIPQKLLEESEAEGGGLERGRKRHGLVPDFKVSGGQLPGWSKAVLAELKVLSCCPSRYKPGKPGRLVKAVGVRAAQLAGEYVKLARGADQRYCGVAAGVQGPVEKRLAGFGMGS